MKTSITPPEQARLFSGLELACANIILFVTIALLFCVVSGISLATPSLILAAFGVFLLILGRLRLFSFYALLGWSFILYIVAQFCIFDVKFAVVQVLCFSFIGGFALYFAGQARRDPGGEPFTRYLPGVFLASVVLLLPYVLLTRPLAALFSSSRFIWLLAHHNDLGFLASTIVLSGCAFLFSPKAEPQPVPLWENIRHERPILRTIGAFNFLINRFFSLLTRRKVALAGTLLAYIFIILCGSRASLFSCSAIALAFWGKHIWRRPKLRKIFLVCAVSGLSIYLILVLNPATRQYMPGHSITRMVKVVTNITEDATFQSRKPAWESAWKGFTRSPVIGNGINSFTDLHREYTIENIGRLKEQLGRWTVFFDTLVLTHAHNQWLMLLAETGIIGTSLFAALFFLTFGYAVIKRETLGVTLPLLCYYLVIMLFEAPLYTPPTGGILMLVFGFLACESAQTRNPRGTPASQPEAPA